MKRKIALLLAALLLASGCGGLSKPEPTPEPTSTPEPTATAGPAWLEDMPFDLTWTECVYTGTYTGALYTGVPEGQGVFEGADAAGAALRWEADGAPESPRERGS